MRTTFWTSGVALAVVLGTAFIWMVLAGGRVVYHGAAGQEPLAAGAETIERKNGPITARPKIIVDELEHDLGVVDSSGECQHVFVIRNEGQAPLWLRRGSTTCKCTMSALPPGPIPPGGKAGVRVSSKLDATAADTFSDEKEGVFSHGATIFTNDPDKPAITLRIRGMVRVPLAVRPSPVVFGRLSRGTSRTMPVVVYSQRWKGFAIQNVESSLEGLTWQIEPADPEALADLGARSGYRLTITTPPELPGGAFRAWLQMTVVPEDPDELPQPLKLAVLGDVARSISIYGKHLLGGKVLNLGRVDSRLGAKEQLTMTVRDEHRVIAVKRIETRPGFLQVSVVPYPTDSTRVGLYQINVEIPPGAPAANFMGVHRGEVRIETDHPAAPALEFEVEFAVVSP